MTRFEELKKRAETQKARIIRAQASVEAIEKGWMDRFGTKDAEEVKAIRDKAEADLKAAQERMETRMAEAEAILAKMEAV